MFGELACFGASSRDVLAMLVTRNLEIEALILVLSTMLRTGVTIMGLDAEYQMSEKSVLLSVWARK